MSLKRLSTIFQGSNLLRDLLVAVIAVAAVTALRLLLLPVLYDRAAFLLFGLAVMISSWTAFPEPTGRGLQNETLVALFAVEGCGISFLAGQLREQRSRAKQEALDATRAQNGISDLIESIPDGFQAFDPVHESGS